MKAHRDLPQCKLEGVALAAERRGRGRASRSVRADVSVVRKTCLVLVWMMLVANVQMLMKQALVHMEMTMSLSK